ncbi:hypothetical protein G6052_17745 [Stenotrophomonas maltophilia]|nr:hypothetical protein G6052_17745 [Stenotrophomonas maltophilia]
MSREGQGGKRALRIYPPWWTQPRPSSEGSCTASPNAAVAQPSRAPGPF